MALWATTVLFSFSRNLVCNLTTQKERRKRNPQQTSHNPKRGFQISTRAFHPQQGGLATVLQANTSPLSSPGSTLCCEDRQGLQLVRLPLQLELGPGLRGMKGWKRLQVDSERMKATSGGEGRALDSQCGSLGTTPLCLFQNRWESRERWPEPLSAQHRRDCQIKGLQPRRRV